MDALLTRSGIRDAKTDIGKAEIYLRAAPDCTLTGDEVKKLIEGDFGYGFRGFDRTDKKWEELGAAGR